MLMPSTSKKQANFMAAVAHNPEFAKKVGVSKDVGEEFNKADKGKKFGTGNRPDLQGINKPKTDHGSMSLFKKGGVMKSDMKEDTKMDKSQDKAMIKKAFKQHDAQEHKGGKGTNLALKKGGMPMVMKDGKKIPAFAAKKGGMTKMADGGMTDPRAKMMMAKLGADRAGRAMPAPTADMRGRAMPKRPMAAEAAPMMKKGGMTKMAKGGGIESKGKTKGTMVTMKRGGKTC
jgi:hypothetical protein